jgi:hypothetical protein
MRHQASEIAESGQNATISHALYSVLVRQILNWDLDQVFLANKTVSAQTFFLCSKVAVLTGMRAQVVSTVQERVNFANQFSVLINILGTFMV